MNKLKRLYYQYLEKRKPLKYCKKIGIKIGKDCHFTGKMDFGSEPYLLDIGNHVLIAGADFITHEGGVWVLGGLDKEKYENAIGYGKIVIKDNVFIGHKCTILRGVTIGENTIVGACSLVNKSLEPNSVYAGVPAKKICSLKEFEAKYMADVPEFDLENYKKNKKDEVLKIVDKFRKR